MKRALGFTLVELLVALFVMALLAILSWRGLDGMTRAQAATEARADEVLTLQTGLAQWKSDLDALVQLPQMTALEWNGRVLRMTRRGTASPTDGVRVVAWTRRDGQWLRWQSPPLAMRGDVESAWLQADQPGRYRGQCAEYCGAQHAKMAFDVVAQPPADFERWRQAQLRGAAPPATAAQARGLALVTFRCGLCHAVRGTDAGAHAAPDLTHLMSRATLASGMIPNNVGTLAGWVQAPQAIKPGSLMPDQHLTGPQIADVTAYLETLK